MAFSISDDRIAKLFAEGKAGAKHPVESTGDKLFYHGNLIAKWEKDGLHISNGGYVPRSGATGSLSTKFLLNALPNVGFYQKNKKWYFSSSNVEWDGEWVHIVGSKAPQSFRPADRKYISLRTEYIRTSAWRGYSQPVHYVAGASDTGMSSDSPCPSNVAADELMKAKEVLKKEKIKFKETICETSNVFCVHRYIVTAQEDRERAIELLKPLAENTSLLYVA